MMVSRIRCVSAAVRIRPIAISAHAAGVRARCRHRRRLCDPAWVRAATTLRPSLSTMKLTSSPSRNSSITSGGPSVSKRGFGLGAIVRDDYAFAGRQAVGLDDHRIIEVRRARRCASAAVSTRQKRAVGMPSAA